MAVKRSARGSPDRAELRRLERFFERLRPEAPTFEIDYPPEAAQRAKKAAERLFAAMRTASVLRFDPFEIARWNPAENRCSDVIARLLEPTGSHGLGLQPLCALLDCVQDEGRARAEAIKSLLED